jgi:hypothetical protein
MDASFSPHIILAIIGAAGSQTQAHPDWCAVRDVVDAYHHRIQKLALDEK